MQADQGTVATISSLPVEILSKIFLEGSETWRHFEPLSLPFPTIVWGVCVRWREISKGMPELWTYIVPPLHKELDDCLEWTSNWLERSKTMHVCVILDDMATTTGLQATASERKIAKILNLLLKHTHSLYRLDVRAASQGAFKKFMRDLWKAPILEELSLCSRQDTHYGLFFKPSEEQSKWSILPKLSNLKKFRFQNISPPCIPSLTSLTAYDLHLDHGGIKTLFTGCPRLAHLVLYDLRPVAPRQGPAPYQPITLPAMRSIAVQVSRWYADDEDWQLPYPFSLLRLPNLDYLEIRGNMPGIKRLFGSSLSSAPVQKLRLSNMTRLREDIGYLQQLFNLEELELFDVPASRLLLPTNAQSDGRGKHVKSLSSTWPRLRSITLDTSDLDTLLSTLDFVESRSSRPHLRLRNLSLSHKAMRLLSEGDERSDAHPRLMGKFGEQEGVKWLENLLEVTLLKERFLGHLDSDRVPLAEMP